MKGTAFLKIMHLFETDVKRQFKVIYNEKICHLWNTLTVRIVKFERSRDLIKTVFRKFKVLFSADLSVQ